MGETMSLKVMRDPVEPAASPGMVGYPAKSGVNSWMTTHDDRRSSCGTGLRRLRCARHAIHRNL